MQNELGPFVRIASTRFPSIPQVDALKKLLDGFISLGERTTEVEKRNRDLEDLLSYEDVAHYDFTGHISLGGGMSVISPVGQWGAGVVKNEDGKLSWSCQYAE
jgi:hypothetical protein